MRREGEEKWYKDEMIEKRWLRLWLWSDGEKETSGEGIMGVFWIVVFAKEASKILDIKPINKLRWSLKERETAEVKLNAVDLFVFETFKRFAFIDRMGVWVFTENDEVSNSCFALWSVRSDKTSNTPFVKIEIQYKSGLLERNLKKD